MNYPSNADGSPNSYTILGTANAGVVKPLPGTVYGLIVHNKNATKRYLQLFNQATTPVNSEVPAFAPLEVPATGEATLGVVGLHCSTAIAWAFSTAMNSLTLGDAADVTVTILYR